MHMESTTTVWKRKEFIAYLMLYAAMTDGVLEKLEKRDIVEKMGQEVYDTVNAIFEKDDEANSVKRIKDYVAHHNLENEVSSILQEVDRIFYVNGSYEDSEVDRYISIKKLLGA